MITDSNVTEQLLKVTSINFPLFADYCKYLDKGLRKDALRCLDRFLDDAKNWDYLTRASFCKAIFSVSSNTSNDIEFALTTNLTEKLVKPTLIEMTTQEPDNYLAFKWYGQYFRDTAFMKKAYELNPSDNSTIIILLNRLENDLWLSTHHLPDWYLGDMENDEQDIRLAFSLIPGLNDNITNDFFNIFTDYKKAIEEFKQHDPKRYH
jgi:tetratricopeptide (TPR) repeat protein